MSGPGPATIHVRLPDEAVHVWRPVLATPLSGDRYRIVDQLYDGSDEQWQFDPGDDVVCEWIDGGGGPFLAAVRRA